MSQQAPATDAMEDANKPTRRPAGAFRYAFYDAKNHKHRIRSPRKLLLLIKYDIIDEKTPIFDEVRKVWTSARHIKAYRIAAGIETAEATPAARPDHTATASSSAREMPARARRRWRLPAATALLIGALGGGAYFALHGVKPTTDLAATRAPAPRIGPAPVPDADIVQRDAPAPAPDSRQRDARVDSVFFSELKTVLDRHLATLSKTDVELLLSPGTFADAERVAAARRTAVGYSTAIANFDADVTRHIRAFEDRLDTPDDPALSNNRSMSRILDSVVRAREQFAELINAYREVGTRLDQFTERMERTFDYYSYDEREDRLFFDHSSENEHYARVRTETAQYLGNISLLHERLNRLIREALRPPAATRL